MSKIYSFIIALCLFVSSAVVAEAAEWVYLTSHNSLNGDVYYDPGSVTLNGNIIKVTLKAKDKKYASKYFIIASEIREEKVGTVTVHKVFYTKQDEYTNDGTFVSSMARNDYMGIVEINHKPFQTIIDYAYTHAPVEPGSEPNLKQKKWQVVASSYTKGVVWVNPDSIKDLPNGNMAFEFLIEIAPNSLALEGYVDNDNQFHVGKYKLYNGIHCRQVEQGNDELLPPSFRVAANDAIKMARHLQEKYNLH